PGGWGAGAGGAEAGGAAAGGVGSGPDGAGAGAGTAASSSAVRWILPPVTFSLRVQSANPFFFTVTSRTPGAMVTVDGVLPTNAPSISMSAPGGVESMTSELSATAGWVGGAARGGATPKLAMFRCMSPSTKAVISVPCGMVMSLPFTKRKSGAAGKNTIEVATMAPVIAPTWPPPLLSWVARSAAF